MLLKRLFFAACLIGLSLVLNVRQALACSGYPYFSLSSLPEMDLIVRATVLETDDRGFNAVLRIQDYYKGEGGPLVTVMRYSPALAAGALVRGYDTGCLYAGRGPQFQPGAQGYFALKSNGDGTYTDDYGGAAQFYPVDGVLTFQQGATEGYAVEFDDPLSVREDEFVQVLLEAGERTEPVQPSLNNPQFYPLMRFLTLTTENGTHYQVNPDRSVLPLPEDGPLAISPDGAHVAFREDENIIAFQYIWTEYTYTGEFAEGRAEWLDDLKKPGEAVRFSSDSNFAAVWDWEQLTVYMLSNDSESSYYGYGTGLRLTEVAQVSLTTDEDNALPQVLWSQAGTTLVWQDGSGLWRWNLIEDAEPTQLQTAADSSAPLLDVSTYGRFVRVGEATDWMLIDGVTLETYPNAVASPTEQFLIYFNTSPETVEVGANDCTPPLRDTCAVYLQTEQPASVFTYQYNLLGVVNCTDLLRNCEIEGESWHPAIGETSRSGGRLIDVDINDVRQIAYDPQYSQPALLVDDYEIYFGFYDEYWMDDSETRPYLDILDLEEVVDSPIVSIEWGQPVFYDEYLLMTAEHRPR